jgi:glycosyltransferase involved in cell wall biosynthesis
MNPEITIGMPVYNEGRYISQTIESALSQTFGNFQIIISDNNSQDNTYEICCSYAKKDSRIKIFRQKKNIGALENFKFVLEKAHTPYFIYLSGHDLWHPQLLEKLLDGFKNFSDSDLVLVFPRASWIDGEEIVEEHDTTDIDNPVDRYKFIVKNLRWCTLFYGLWKTEIIKRLNFQKIIRADMLILAEASLIGKFKKIKEEILFFRRKNYDYVHDDILSVRRQIQNIISQNDKIVGKIRKTLTKDPRSPLFKFWLSLETLAFIFEHTKMILGSQKIGVNLKTTEKVHLATWTLFILVGYNLPILLNAQFARIIYKYYKKINSITKSILTTKMKIY